MKTTNFIPDRCFQSLVKNALEFMEEAIVQIAEKPKYSLINFYTSLELFLKARLLKEHWTLIVQKPDTATQLAFNSGDFHSVALNDLHKRLRDICGVNIKKENIDCFDNLRKHRNQLVHFFSDKYQSQKAYSVTNIVAEQCRAWYALHKYLVNDWQNIFIDFSSEIEALNNKIHKHRIYLEIKFDECKPEIEKLIAQGKTIKGCLSCEFESAVEEHFHGPVSIQTCIVCGHSDKFIKTNCRKCNEDVELFDTQVEHCPKCNSEILISDLIDEYSDHISPEESLTEPYIASCSECQGFETAAIVDDIWLCFSCLEKFDEIHQCGWCGQNITGEYEEDRDTFLNGCENCDGRIGWKDD